MRMNLISKFLTGTMMVSVLVPSSLFAETVKGTVDKKIVTNWNRTASNWPTLKTPSEMEREIKKMNLNYNTRFEGQDEKFIQSLVSQLSEFPVVKIKGDSYECFDKKSGSLLFTAKVLGDNKYTFNGKAFEYDLKASLESNVSRIKDLVMTEKVSFLDQALIPQAHAMKTLAIVALSVGAAILVGATVFSEGKNWKNFGSQASDTVGHGLKTIGAPFGVPGTEK